MTAANGVLFGKYMKSQILITAAVAAWAAGAATFVGEPAVQETSTVPSAAELRSMIARFAPVDIRADVAALPENEQRAVGKLVAAARIMDALFLRQVWSGNDALLQRVSRDAHERVRQGGAAGSDAFDLPLLRLHYFLINKGPWSRLDHNRPFVPDVPAKPEAAHFYPPGATKAEVQKWMDSLAGPEKTQALGFFTTIRRGDGGRFLAVPYSIEDQGELAMAAALLREAATLTKDATLKKYLDQPRRRVPVQRLLRQRRRVDGARRRDRAHHRPVQTYEDEWFNYKAAFEAFITLRDDAESKKLQTFSAHLQELESALPIDAKYRNPKLGAMAPIRVVNVVFTAGDANRGVQTAAFNLPNDERVIKEKGSKRVMLKNVQEAKFKMVLAPISKVALPAADQKQLSFDAFFTHILMHELMHGLGPHNITVAGRASTVRQELKETYSAIEEAKADISGLWALGRLADKQHLDTAIARTLHTTFLASAFRSIRFGINEAHGRGIAIQLNYLLDAGAFQVNPDGTFSVDESKMAAAVTSLTRELMTLQAEGNYAKAKALIEELGVVRPPVQKVLDRLASVPVDIEPRFTSAK